MSTPAGTRAATPGAGWCLLRFPLLPARPRDGVAETEKRLLRLAIDYVATFRRGEEHDRSWREETSLLRRYEARARYRATPFGLFAITMVADVGPRAEQATIDMEKEVWLRSAAHPVVSGRWLVNPTLTFDGGRWAIVRPDTGGITSAPDNDLLREAAKELSSTPRSAQEWAEVLGEQKLRQAQDKHILIEELDPAPLVSAGEAPGVVTSLGQALTEERPFRPDVLTDAYTTTRAVVAQADISELLAAAARMVTRSGLPQQLDGVRNHLREQFSGAAVPLLWLLSAPATHPFGSWRRALSSERGDELGFRIFVPRERRDASYAHKLVMDRSLDEWTRDLKIPAAPPVRRVPRGMAVGAVLAEPMSGAGTWLRGIVGGLYLGPGARTAEPLGLAAPAFGGDASQVEISWALGGPSGPLLRRPEGGLPRLNVNTAHRPGDVRLADLSVVLAEERLQVVHRADGRAVQWHHDSPLTLSSTLNPWAVQLLGLLIGEAGLLAMPADPLATLSPGSVVPRLTIGKCLVSRRGVSLGPTHRADLLALTARPQELCQVTTELGLGHVVEVTESFDKVMRLDLSDSDDVGWLAKRLRREHPLDLHEALPLATPVTSAMGEHVHEIWAPWLHATAESRPVSARRMIEVLPQPDKAWLSWHVYAPDQLVERWLARPDMFSLMRAKQLFFIRYQDQRPHLRIRLHCTVDTVAALESLTGFLSAASPHHPCEVVAQAWTPEDYRYGGPQAREAVLAHFCADSAWWTQRVAARAPVDERFALAAARLAAWCTHLAGDGAFDLFTRVQQLDAALPSPLGQRAWMETFRRRRHELDTLFKEFAGSPEPTLDFLHELDEDAHDLALHSLMHMTVNRGLPLSQAVSREGEVVMAAARLLKARAMAGRGGRRGEPA